MNQAKRSSPFGGRDVVEDSVDVTEVNGSSVPNSSTRQNDTRELPYRPAACLMAFSAVSAPTTRDFGNTLAR